MLLQVDYGSMESTERWFIMQVTSSNQELFKRLAIRFLLAILILFFLFYGLPIVFELFYPFIFAGILAAIVNPFVNLVDNWLSKLKIKSSTSRSIVTLLLTFIILSGLLAILYLVFSTFFYEVSELASSIQENWPSIVRLVSNAQRWLTAQIDILHPEVIAIIEGVIENVLEFIRNLSGNLLNYTVTFTGLIISKAGSVTLTSLTFFLSLYFIMSDFDAMKSFIRKRTDRRILDTAHLLKETTVVGVWGYIKTQLILALLAFSVMFLSFSLYGIEYALTISVILALVDVIPLIGTIGLLTPWGLFEFFIGDSNFGIFLLVLGVGFFILRRLTEPKVMGTQTGLHPLFALIGIYVGIQFSGLWGALLGPLVMVVLIGFMRSGILDNTLADMRDLYYKTTHALKRK